MKHARLVVTFFLVFGVSSAWAQEDAGLPLPTPRRTMPSWLLPTYPDGIEGYERIQRLATRIDAFRDRVFESDAAEYQARADFVTELRAVSAFLDRAHTTQYLKLDGEFNRVLFEATLTNDARGVPLFDQPFIEHAVRVLGSGPEHRQDVGRALWRIQYLRSLRVGAGPMDEESARATAELIERRVRDGERGVNRLRLPRDLPKDFLPFLTQYVEQEARRLRESKILVKRPGGKPVARTVAELVAELVAEAAAASPTSGGMADALDSWTR